MTKKQIPSTSQKSTGEVNHLTKRDEIDILLTEYNQLNTQARMYVEQLSPKFTTFAVFVLSALAFALQNPSYNLVYPIIPLFVFLLTSFTAGQFYIIGIIAGRVRAIESRIKNLNGGSPILEWESKVTPKYIYAALVRVPLKGKTGTIKIPSPQFIGVIYMVVSVLPLVIYSTYKSFFVIPKPMNIVYIVFVGVSSLVIIAEAFSFFIFDKISDDTG